MAEEIIIFDQQMLGNVLQLFEHGAMMYLDDIKPVARRTDPQTSHDAAKRAERFAATHAGKIIAALKAHGPSTPEGLSLVTGLTVVQIDRRMHEIQAQGLAEPTGEVVNGFRVWRCAA